MNPNDINNIRDAASLLRGSNPKLAFKLFSLALRYRPNGEYIKKSLKEIKEQAGIKTFFVIGNCQADVISKLIETKSESYISLGAISAHTYQFSESIFEILDSVDYIITQNISEKFEGINTNTLSRKYSSKLVKILNLYFEGYHPDWCYLPTVKGIRLQSPVGDYHNRTILESFVYNLPENDALKNYKCESFNEKKYSSVAKRSLLELRKREADVDIKMSDIIDTAFENGKVMFHTFNHPKMELLNVQVERILSFLNLTSNEVCIEGECLDQFIMRTDVNFSGSNAVSDCIKGGERVNMEAFVADCYEIYRNNPDFIKAFMLRDNIV